MLKNTIGSQIILSGHYAYIIKQVILLLIVFLVSLPLQTSDCDFTVNFLEKNKQYFKK